MIAVLGFALSDFWNGIYFSESDSISDIDSDFSYDVASD
jgi:hypothetical protein